MYVYFACICCLYYILFTFISDTLDKTMCLVCSRRLYMKVGFHGVNEIKKEANSYPFVFGSLYRSTLCHPIGCF